MHSPPLQDPRQERAAERSCCHCCWPFLPQKEGKENRSLSKGEKGKMMLTRKGNESQESTSAMSLG